MSVIFGLVREEGTVVKEDELRAMGDSTSRYAEEGTKLRAFGRAGMGVQPYSTHERSSLDSSPLSDRFGNAVVLDGRLDNFDILCNLLGLKGQVTSDSEIVLAGFARWGKDCFARFTGDWAIAIWSLQDESLYLARDHAGTRTLYFSQTREGFRFSTYLETFLHGKHRPSLDEEYATRYLSGLPTGDRTPYRDVTAVTPAHFLLFAGGQLRRCAHWDWVSKDLIEYQDDREYEDHFLELFAQSVKRRTGPGAPILAQLSGGMDSSSIVCMSDSLRRSKGASAGDLLDTISYFDDTEPHWNERPYFSAVEHFRGKRGHHVDVSDRSQTLEELPGSDGFYSLPGSDKSSKAAEQVLDSIVASGGYRVLLSGIGGDELLGGVPSTIPQLADLLVSGQMRSFGSVALESCISTRRPFIELLLEAATYPLRLHFHRQIPNSNRLPPWLTRRAVYVLKRSAPPYPECRSIRSRPSAVASGMGWWGLLETMPHLAPRIGLRLEYRYPYLDRDLVDYLHRIPNGQLVRPGRRRSLMRRALSGIVPSEVLERRRKGFLSRSRGMLLVEKSESLRLRMAHSDLISVGLVDSAVLDHHLSDPISREQEKWVPALTRAVLFDIFIRSLARAT
jgi:asparagine synthase (glutamine-hydrolysing)